jgi:hypothetical protein
MPALHLHHAAGGKNLQDLPDLASTQCEQENKKVAARETMPALHRVRDDSVPTPTQVRHFSDTSIEILWKWYGNTGLMSALAGRLQQVTTVTRIGMPELPI